VNSRALWLYGALIVVARLVLLPFNDLWFDEIFSYQLALMSPADILERTARDVHPPLYYWMLHPFAVHIGESPFWLRLPGALAGLAALALLADAARRWSSPRAGAIVLLLGGVSSCQAYFAAEARSYTLAAMGIAMTIWAVAMLRERRAAWAWGAWAAGLVIGCWSHNLASLAAPFLVIGTACVLHEWKLPIIVGGIAAALTMPWALSIAQQVGLMGEALTWMHRPTTGGLLLAATGYPLVLAATWEPRYMPLVAWYSVAVAAMLPALALPLRDDCDSHRRRAIGVLIVGTLFYLISAHVISHTIVRLVYPPRIALLTGLPLFLALGLALDSPGVSQRLRAALLAVLVSLPLYDSIRQLVVPSHPPTRRALRLAASELDPGEVLWIFVAGNNAVSESLFHTESLMRQGIRVPLRTLIEATELPHRPPRMLVGMFTGSAAVRAAFREPLVEWLRNNVVPHSTLAWRRDLGAGWEVLQLEDIRWERVPAFEMK